MWHPRAPRRSRQIELALYGGRHLHGAPATPAPAEVPHRDIKQREVAALAASGAYRAVVAGTGGRVALWAAAAGARRAGVPFIFWAAFWRTLRTPAHLAAYPLMRQVYRRSAAVITYGEHVSTYVSARGASNVHIAPQSVDNEFWSAGAHDRGSDGPLRALFAGRADHAKGLHVLLAAWRQSALAREGATLTLAGNSEAPHHAPDAVRAVGLLPPAELRELYGAADVVVIPSIPTRGFLEPWGLVANEAMNQGAAIIASDAVGAAAGGLVRDGRNGLVVPAGDAGALAMALRSLHGDRDRCHRLGTAGREDVRPYTQTAWVEGFGAALLSVGVASPRDA